MTKQKKILSAVLACALVAVIVVGGTVAYLFTKSEKKTNVFTFADNVDAVFDEPGFDPDEALNLVPGVKIKKDPQLTNLSKNGVDLYAAVRVVFTNGAGEVVDGVDGEGHKDIVRLLNLLTIDWSDKWVLIEGTLEVEGGVVTDATPEMIFRYEEAIEPDVTTVPLFSSVTVNRDVTPEDLAWLAGDYGHEEECYETGDCECAVKYRHHALCSDAAGELTEDEECDYGCTPVAVHEKDCPARILSVKMEDGKVVCEHTKVLGGLGNFNIVVDAAAAQADAFGDIEDAEVLAGLNAELIGLFEEDEADD